MCGRMPRNALAGEIGFQMSGNPTGSYPARFFVKTENAV